MRYCSICILPETRPGIHFDAGGVCSACQGHRDKAEKIDWTSRRGELDRIAAEAKARSAGYDCIVPVSGGKDSWYEVIVCQELGLKVLGVTWRTPARTGIGQRNLDAMISNLGIDHIDYSIDPDVERRFMKLAYERAGAIGLPMHMALFAIPIRLAAQLRIPLVVWGENPQLEYGGEEAERLATDLDAEWLAKHGCLQSTNADDWVGEELSAADLAAYRLPVGPDFVPRSIFLGSFLKWSSFENAKIAESRGYTYEADNPRTGVWSFADIDCDFISLHHYLKWQKFGFTRAFDNLSVEIREGRIDRGRAIEVLREVGLQTPQADIEKFCRFVGEPETWFWEVAERFRNQEIWKLDGNVWKIPDFIIPDWSW